MKPRLPSPLPFLAALLAIYLLAPLAAGLARAPGADWREVLRPAFLDASLVSLASATISTFIIALFGIPLGYLLARRKGPFFALLGFLVQLPLALPPLASGILLLFLFGYSSPLGRLTGGIFTDSFLGIVLAETFVAAPFLIVAARSAFAAVDPLLERLAATFGRGRLASFFRVSLPLAWPAASSGLLLAWLRAFGEFGATVMVAYHPYSLPVYTYVAFGARGLRASLPIVMPALALAFLVLAVASALAQRGATRRSFARRENGPALLPAARPPFLAPAPERLAAASELELCLEKRLDGFRLDLAWKARAGRLAILGPSGSGKSLTLRLIAGIERADRARITLGGRELSRLDPAARGIGYVPQNFGLFPHLDLRGQLSFPAAADPRLAAEWIERLSLRGLEGRTPEALSLGQQQRVALARALVRPAFLLLLDEPFSALDAPLRARLRRELLSVQQGLGATTILVTHDPEEAALLADEVLVLERGRVLQSGPSREIFRRPKNARVARLIGALDGGEGVAVAADRIAIGCGVVLELASPPLAKGLAVGWSVKPERVRIVPSGAYPGFIESVLPVGSGAQLSLRLGEARLPVWHEDAGIEPGPCAVEIDPRAIQVWPREEDETENKG